MEALRAGYDRWSQQRPQPEVWRGKGHHGRAQRFGVEYESVDVGAVFERDCWLCQLCEVPVDRSLVWPDPLSASLDHIVPMSRGGGHIYRNVQLAHLGCNLAKGAGGGPDGWSWPGSEGSS